MSLLAAATLLAGAAGAAVDNIRGLPFVRSYPLDEIGYIPRGSHLAFDAYGRLTLVHSGAYVVLNDTTWVRSTISEDDHDIAIANVVVGRDGQTYYGARGSWGRIETRANGTQHPVSFVPENAPKWIVTASFEDLLATDEGVYFAGPNGVVRYEYASRRSQLFEFPGTQKIFAIGKQVYVSTYGKPLALFDVRRGELQAVPNVAAGGSAIEFTARLNGSTTLLCLRNSRLLAYDGHQVSPWDAQTEHGLTGKISDMRELPEGGVAIAVFGKGLFFFSPEGKLTLALSTARYHRITALACREPGVLWAFTEDTIEKILYRSPLSSFGQQLGLPANWPVVARWDDRIFVVSSGKLYEAMPEAQGALTRFEPRPNQPPAEAWVLASNGESMLVGNAVAVLQAEHDGGYTRVTSVRGLSQLAMLGPDLCFAVGTEEITLLQFKDGRWRESPAPHLKGNFFIGGVRPTKRAVWIEMGAAGVARLSFDGEKLQLRKIDLPWPDEQWTNVGIVGDTVVLTSLPGRRVFFDDKSETWCEAPELKSLLDRAPYWILRVRADADGVLWATHSSGVVTFTPRDGGYEMDAASFDLVNDRFPQIHFLPENDIWVSAGRALYRVQRNNPLLTHVLPPPVLVPVTSARGLGVAVGPARSAKRVELPFNESNLVFRVFSGTYRWLRAPAYEYRLAGTERWTPLDAGAMLSIGGLREGPQQLEVRVPDSRAEPQAVTSIRFQVLPPWYRTPPAYVSYALLLIGAFYGAVRLAVLLQRKRNRVLEKLVRERTKQLEDTMEKLNGETRNAATLAERNRLAGEIHDSLQQGLSGAILQLDSTLLLPTIDGDLRTRLNVVRNMVSYSRHEVQHAVWDMESPLLQGAGLDSALQKLTDYVNSGAAKIDVAVSGRPVELASGLQHNLLRIAQEAITNAVRHANATRIAIQLDYAADAVNLTISDDGAGFRAEEVLSNKRGHFGLRGLHGRAKRLGGRIEIQSAPGKGTRIHVVVPLGANPSSPSHAENRPA
ncbi:sensor histidine kinase [Opitutaceae bacterium EW11]|nr:sensor histidine kinase [Opitutaceae bacterium EW11]